MKRFEFVKFTKDIEKIDISGFNKFLVYAIKLTKNKYQSFIDEILEKEKELFFEEYINAENIRLSILSKYSQKDESNNPIIINNEFLINNIEECKKELQENFEKNKEIFEKYEALRKEYDNFMKEEIEITFVKTSFVNLPEIIKDNLTDNILYKFVKESEEEIEKIIGN